MQERGSSAKTRSRTAAGQRPAGLMVTCLVDLMRPVIGHATVRLLEAAGCSVTVPLAQTCCGQPAYNAGSRTDARALAKRVIAMFEGIEYVVVPSGSCAGMLRVHYPKLFYGDDDGAWCQRARDLAGRTWELTAFLNEVCDFKADADHMAMATYHDGCAGLREMGVKDQPRKLLAGCRGMALSEMAETDRCCGFGGTFCVKFDAISAQMGRRKLDHAQAAGADLVVSGELGCLLHLAGLAEAEGRALAFRHVAEILAGTTDPPALGGNGSR